MWISKDASTVLPQLTLQNVHITSGVCSPFTSETADDLGRVTPLLPGGLVLAEGERASLVSSVAVTSSAFFCFFF